MTIRGMEEDKAIQFRAFHGLGQVAKRSDRVEDATRYHRRAIECIDAIRHTLHVESYRAAFMTDKLSAFSRIGRDFVGARRLRFSLFSCRARQVQGDCRKIGVATFC